MTLPMIYYRDLRGVLQTMLFLPVLLFVLYLIEQVVFPIFYQVQATGNKVLYG